MEIVAISLVCLALVAFSFLTRRDANQTIAALKTMLDEERRERVDAVKEQATVYEARIKVLNDRIDSTFQQAMTASTMLATTKAIKARPVTPPPAKKPPAFMGSVNGGPRSSFPEDPE